MRSSLLIALLLLCTVQIGCEPNGSSQDASSAAVNDLNRDLVGEWSSAHRGDAEGETIIFARDGSVVLREGNSILHASSPVPTGGRLAYEVNERIEPAHLDFVVTNSAGEQVARIPGVVKVLTDDQVQVCMDSNTLTRPADFNGNCIVLTKMTGTSRQQPERIVVEQPVYTSPSAPAPTPASTSPVAYANSPGDGFVALRSDPSVRSGRRITRIPHGASMDLHGCQQSTSAVGSTQGHWCEVSYGGQYGWAFDAYLIR